jgi:hypothetical protein
MTKVRLNNAALLLIMTMPARYAAADCTSGTCNVWFDLRSTDAQLASDYADARKADAKYKGKTLFLQGQVLAVAPNAALTLNGNVTALMRYGYEDQASKLAVGDRLTLLCVGAGIVNGHPIVTNCVARDDSDRIPRLYQDGYRVESRWPSGNRQKSRASLVNFLVEALEKGAARVAQVRQPQNPRWDGCVSYVSLSEVQISGCVITFTKHTGMICDRTDEAPDRQSAFDDRDFTVRFSGLSHQRSYVASSDSVEGDSPTIRDFVLILTAASDGAISSTAQPKSAENRADSELSIPFESEDLANRTLRAFGSLIDTCSARRASQ